jgi:hypothetical protein
MDESYMAIHSLRLHDLSQATGLVSLLIAGGQGNKDMAWNAANMYGAYKCIFCLASANKHSSAHFFLHLVVLVR